MRASPDLAAADQAHAQLRTKLTRLTGIAGQYIEACGDTMQAASALAGDLREIPSCVLAALLATELVRRAQAERAS